METIIKLIGKVHSELKRIEDCPLQESENAPAAYVELYPAFAEGTKNISAGDKLILLTWFHLANREILKCYPRNEVNSAHVGVFSTRSPDRPNPIGLHHVKVLEVTSTGWLKVHPLEALDGTPVIDIKPVIK
jgi:tRNA-Thr(GGU) m(6)t(6)A37 methyltransferase TsaA